MNETPISQDSHHPESVIMLSLQDRMSYLIKTIQTQHPELYHELIEMERDLWEGEDNLPNEITMGSHLGESILSIVSNINSNLIHQPVNISDTDELAEIDQVELIWKYILQNDQEQRLAELSSQLAIRPTPEDLQLEVERERELQEPADSFRLNVNLSTLNIGERFNILVGILKREYPDVFKLLLVKQETTNKIPFQDGRLAINSKVSGILKDIVSMDREESIYAAIPENERDSIVYQTAANVWKMILDENPWPPQAEIDQTAKELLAQLDLPNSPEAIQEEAERNMF